MDGNICLKSTELRQFFQPSSCTYLSCISTSVFRRKKVMTRFFADSHHDVKKAQTLVSTMHGRYWIGNHGRPHLWLSGKLHQIQCLTTKNHYEISSFGWFWLETALLEKAPSCDTSLMANSRKCPTRQSGWTSSQGWSTSEVGPGWSFNSGTLLAKRGSAR